MAQTFSCPKCKQPLHIPEGLAGKSIRCPHCQQTLTIRVPAPAPPPAAAVPAAPAGPAAVRLCPSCKSKLRPGARSCMDCGFFLSGTPAAPAPPPPQAVAAPPPPVAAAAPIVAPAPAVLVPPAPPVAPKPPYWRLLPAGLLGLLLGIMVLRDMIFSPAAPADDETVVDAPIDSNPRLKVLFVEGDTMQFGLSMTRDRDEQGRPKRLTFSERGASNFPCLAIDAKPYLFGRFSIVHGPVVKQNGEMVSDPSQASGEAVPGRWETQQAHLGRAADGRERIGRQSVWVYDRYKLWMTQTVEIVPSPTPAPPENKRLLDTALVRYRIENKDSRSHKVGLRYELDTFIGSNDGVPFTIPGRSSLCDTQCDFSRPEDVPDFVQALEYPSLEKPGTIAHLTLKVGGGLEAPSRVTLGGRSDADAQRVDGEWLAASWTVPVKPIGRDSVVVLYWGERDLPAGASRDVGFAYGLGSVSSGEGSGRLGLTVGGSLRPGDPFTVTAYVKDPGPGQTVTLQLGRGLEMAQGEATQPVPPLPADAASRNSPVTWKVKASRPGSFTLKVQSSTGAAQTESVTIRKGSALFD